MISTGDQTAFGAEVERHRRELQVHCYRMLGSLEDAEDAVQETFLRAWRKRASFASEGRASFRAWLYRIATNVSLDALDRRPRRLLPSQLGPPAEPGGPIEPPADLPWLQPYPDRLLEGIAPAGEEPERAVVERETIELAFLAAIQLLPPRQRAALILRDVLGWSAKETAGLLEASVAAANSALQRARATLGDQRPGGRLEWGPAADASAQERALLQRYMEAHEAGDPDAVVALLSEDVRCTMPPHPTWLLGRESVRLAMAGDGCAPMPDFKFLPTRANMQPAAASYLRAPGDAEYRPFGIDVLRIEGGLVVELTAFNFPELFPAFGLPPTLPAQT